MTPSLREIHSPLVTAAIETERYVAAAGWDQPFRLFALVPTDELLAAEPALAAQIDAPSDPDALSAIEQSDLPDALNVDELLQQLAWPLDVFGVALAVERIVLPPAAEAEVPEDPDEVDAFLINHPDRADVRLLVAVTRDGESTCLLRQRAHDSDDKVALGADIAPGLIAALAHTLRDDAPDEV